MNILHRWLKAAWIALVSTCCPCRSSAALLLGGALALFGAAPLRAASPLDGQAFTVTDSFNGVIQHTSTGLVQAGVLSYGTHVLIPGEADIYGLYVNVYLNPDNNPRIVTNQSGYWLMGNTVSVDFIFPNLSPLEFTGLWNFYHDSAHGYSALSLGDTPNSLRFAFAGEFYNPYGGAFTDWWGYSTAINPNANLGTGGNGDAGPGNSAVPEPSTYGLIGATALFGLSAFRKRRMSKSAACL